MLKIIIVLVLFCASFNAVADVTNEQNLELTKTLGFAQNGNPRAQYNLGLMYEYGNGVRVDYAQAAYWYQKSADQGFAEAQFNLGVMYYHGQGVPYDNAQARYWMRQAAAQGDREARNALQSAFGETW